MAFDIDSRELSEMTDDGFDSSEFLPRADARYRVNLVKVDQGKFGTPSWQGWWITVRVNSVELGKEHPCFQPPAVAGRDYKFSLKEVGGHKYADQNDKDLFALRQLCASATGQECTPDVKVGGILAAVEAEGADLTLLKEFTLICRGYPSKPGKALKEDGTPNPNVGKIFANTALSFTL